MRRYFERDFEREFAYFLLSSGNPVGNNPVTDMKSRRAEISVKSPYEISHFEFFLGD